MLFTTYVDKVHDIQDILKNLMYYTQKKPTLLTYKIHFNDCSKF